MFYLIEKPLDLSGEFTILDDLNNTTDVYKLKQIRALLKTGVEIKGAVKVGRLLQLNEVSLPKSGKKK